MKLPQPKTLLIIGMTAFVASQVNVTQSFLSDREVAEGNVLSVGTWEDEDSAHLVINEFLPNAGINHPHEWIELFNPTASDIDLTGWKLRDLLTSSSDKDLSGTISSGGFYVLDGVNGWLDNGGDTLHLVDPAGTIIDERSYTSSSHDETVGRDPDGSASWGTCNPTKGTSNNGECE